MSSPTRSRKRFQIEQLEDRIAPAWVPWAYWFGPASVELELEPTDVVHTPAPVAFPSELVLIAPDMQLPAAATLQPVLAAAVVPGPVAQDREVSAPPAIRSDDSVTRTLELLAEIEQQFSQAPRELPVSERALELLLEIDRELARKAERNTLPGDALLDHVRHVSAGASTSD